MCVFASCCLSCLVLLLLLCVSNGSGCYGRLIVHPSTSSEQAPTQTPTPSPSPSPNHDSNSTVFVNNSLSPTAFGATAISSAFTCPCPPSSSILSSSSPGACCVSFVAPTWLYVSPSVSGYNITAPLVRVDVTTIQQLEQQRHIIQGNIVWIPNYDIVLIYLESLVRTCASYGCRGVVFSSHDYPHITGVFRFADGSASRCDGCGLSIPLLNICQRDADVLSSIMSATVSSSSSASSHVNDTSANISTNTNTALLLVTITDGDENETLDELNRQVWVWMTIGHIICAGMLWMLAGFRLLQWYLHWRRTKQVSNVAVVSLLLEFCATAIRCGAPQPMVNLTGKYHFWLVHGLNLTQIGCTGLVDILIVTYFAEAIYQSSGASTLGSTSIGFVHRYRWGFFSACFAFVVLLSTSLGLGVDLWARPTLLFSIMQVSYAIVMIVCTILLAFMAWKVTKTLSAVTDSIQANRRKAVKSHISHLTTRVVASILGMVLTIAVALLYLLLGTNSIRDESFWATMLFAGAHLSSLAHIETFHCPRSVSHSTVTSPTRRGRVSASVAPAPGQEPATIKHRMPSAYNLTNNNQRNTPRTFIKLGLSRGMTQHHLIQQQSQDQTKSHQQDMQANNKTPASCSDMEITRIPILPGASTSPPLSNTNQPESADATQKPTQPQEQAQQQPQNTTLAAAPQSSAGHGHVETPRHRGTRVCIH